LKVGAIRNALTATVESIAAVVVMEVGGIASWVAGSSHGRSVAVAAAIVLGGLAVRWLALRTHRRDECLELLIAGDQSHASLAEIERECRRLRDPRFQARLAKALEACATVGAHPHAPIDLHRPMYNRRVVRAVESQLRQLAARLRAGGAELRGVAFLHRMLTAGTSPLYGRRVEPLRDDLTRAAQLLG
jgi:hypothetical protein